MRGKSLGYCEQARDHFKIPDSMYCCNSCHEDTDEYGYALCIKYIGDDYFEVCCSVSNAIDPIKAVIK